MDQEELVSKINQLIKDYHNEKLIKEHMVTIIWCDGEITYEKGDGLFGLRTRHTINFPLFRDSAFLMKHLNFPEIEGKNGCAIVTNEHAKEIRNLLEQLYNKLNEQKPLTIEEMKFQEDKKIADAHTNYINNFLQRVNQS